MTPQYTYKTKHGIFYFRLVLTVDNKFKGTEVRFSLRTRDANEARERAHIAWQTATSIDPNDCTDVKELRTTVQSTTFKKSSTRPDPAFNTPDLVVISKHINRDDRDSIQNAITKVTNAGGKILVPYSPDGFIPDKYADNRCESPPIF